jgi:hypothetical protein
MKRISKQNAGADTVGNDELINKETSISIYNCYSKYDAEYLALSS